MAPTKGKTRFINAYVEECKQRYGCREVPLLIVIAALSLCLSVCVASPVQLVGADKFMNT